MYNTISSAFQIGVMEISHWRSFHDNNNINSGVITLYLYRAFMTRNPIYNLFIFTSDPSFYSPPHSSYLTFTFDIKGVVSIVTPGVMLTQIFTASRTADQRNFYVAHPS